MPALQSNAAYDADVGALTEEYRRAVEATIPDGMCVTGAFWRELTSIVISFSICKQNRASRPPAEQIRRWERVKKLAIELHELRAQDSAPLVALADAQIAGHRTMSEGFDRKRNLHNEALYRWAIDLCRATGLPIRVSRDPVSGEVGGPAVVFIAAVIAPLLDRPLTARGIAEVIGRKAPIPFLAAENIS